MAWFFIALGAQFVLGTADVFDKVLLKRKFFDPWVYTFWLGVLSIFGFLLAPFGFHFVSLIVAAIAIGSGVMLILAVFLLFTALAEGEASTILPLIGALSSIATAGASALLLDGSLGAFERVGFLFLVGAGFLLFFAEERRNLRLRLFALSFGSAFLFGVSNTLSKIVFNHMSFIAGFLWIKIGSVCAVLLPLAIPFVYRKIFAATVVSSTPNRFLYCANRAYAGLGSILLSFAISLSHPALVDASQSFRFVIIFFGSWLWLREVFSGRIFFRKLMATLLMVIGLVWLGLGEYSTRTLPPLDPARRITWGVTFSQKFSEELGLNWKKNYTAILDDLGVRRIRLIAYWDFIEKDQQHFDFSDLDWQFDEANRRGAKAILTIGMKVPRWPECHIPEWAWNLEVGAREDALRSYMQTIVERYRNHPALLMWQVENEPFLRFGVCPKRGKKFVDKEIALVKRLDPRHPILLTDGGELGLWLRAASRADAFGTTMYRRVYPVLIGPLFGVTEYPFRPSFFRVKEKVVRRFINAPEKRFIVIELQGEPWGRLGLPELPYEEQISIFSPEYFSDTLRYAKETGFDEYYLWGAEWWYWVEEKHGDNRFWKAAKDLFRSERI